MKGYILCHWHLKQGFSPVYIYLCIRDLSRSKLDIIQNGTLPKYGQAVPPGSFPCFSLMTLLASQTIFCLLVSDMI